MNFGAQRVCLYAGAAFMPLFGISLLLIAHLVPPTPPSANALEVAKFYQDNYFNLRVGIVLAMLSAPLLYAWSAVIATYTAKVEGPFPVLSFLQLVCSVLVGGALLAAGACIITAAFRPDRPPEIILALSDQAWMWIVLIGSPALAQQLSIGFAILGDKKAQPTLPRRAGYLNLWCALLTLPSSIMPPFVKTGPFAWNGILDFYLAVLAFVIWTLGNTYFMLGAIKREEEAAGARPVALAA